MAKHHSSAAAFVYYVVTSARLVAATMWQAVRFTIGVGRAADVSSRVRRQMEFVRLSEGRRGGL
jgi:hypothetical protein